MNHQLDQTSFIFLYSKFTTCQRRLIGVIFEGEKKKRAGVWNGVYPSNQTLAKWADCHERTVKRFNKKLREYFIPIVQVVKRYEKKVSSRNLQTTNEYFMHPEFFEALRWVEIMGGIKGDNKKLKKLLKWSKKEKQEIVYEKPPVLSPPFDDPVTLLGSLSGLGNKSTGTYINPRIEELGGISGSVASALLTYPEAIREMALEDALWYREQGNRINNLGPFLLRQCSYRKNKAAQRR